MRKSSFEKYIEKEATGKEQKMMSETQELSEPRDEYKEGKLKLDVEYVLPTGELLKATENEEGIASITIRKKDGSVFDFREFVKSEEQFVTPTYLNKIIKNDARLKKMGAERILGRWGHFTAIGAKTKTAVYRLISVGDMKKPSSLFPLLHEMGHACQEIPNYKTENPLPLHTRKSFDTEKSIQERDAWVRAIKMARKLRREHGIDLFKLVEDWDHFKRLIYGSLIHYRYVHQHGAQKDSSLAQRTWQKIFGSKAGKKNLEHLKELFDKEKFTDKS